MVTFTNNLPCDSCNEESSFGYWTAENVEIYLQII
jgi:hypothetical protein